MALIRFTRDHDGFRDGHVQEIGDGVADAYVNWAHAAVYETETDTTEEPAKRGPGRPPLMTRRIPGPREGDANE